MNPERKVSLRNVAVQLGLSPSTVSLALRNDPRLPVVTRELIQAAARKLGYQANSLVSQVMATHRTAQDTGRLGTLGFITAYPTRDGWREPWSQRSYDGARARATQLGYQLEVFWLKEPGMTGRRMTTILQTRNIAGILLAPLARATGHLSLGWPHFAAAAIGYTVRKPQLHRAAPHQFHVVTQALHQLKRLGFRRVGLTLTAGFDERVDNFWTAGYLVHHHRLRVRTPIPMLVMNGLNRREFSQWFTKYRPDAILGGELIILDWLRDLGQKVPADVSFVHIDRSPQHSSITGMDQKPELVGLAAVDLVVNQLHRGERGIPADPKVVLVECQWVEGTTVRAKKATRRARPMFHPLTNAKKSMR